MCDNCPISVDQFFSFLPKKKSPETNPRDARKPIGEAIAMLQSFIGKALIFTALPFLLSFSTVSAESSNDSQVRCSKSCVALNCDTMNIKYGKYCGVGWTGCPGEKPCDDLDACCKIHDECVEKKGLTDVKCHQKFKKCITKVHKSGKAGFSTDCPYDTAVPTMVQAYYVKEGRESVAY